MKLPSYESKPHANLKMASGYPLHPSQEYVSQLLNGVYWSRKNRNGKPMPVKGLFTLEGKNYVGERHEKRLMWVKGTRRY